MDDSGETISFRDFGFLSRDGLAVYLGFVILALEIAQKECFDK